jgi:hypothetical protein
MDTGDFDTCWGVDEEEDFEMGGAFYHEFLRLLYVGETDPP